MKVTALIPDPLIEDLRVLAPFETLTDSLILALSEWTKHQKLLTLNKKLSKNPLKFQDAVSAIRLRAINRKNRDFN